MDFQVLRGLEMDDRKAESFRLLDVCQRVVDEETFPGRLPDPREQDLIDLGTGFHLADLAGNHHVVEQIEKVIALAYGREGFGRPVAQPVERVTSLFEPFQEIDRTGDGTLHGIKPVVVVRLNQMGVMRELSGEDGDAFRKCASFVLLQIPLRKIDVLKEALHGFRVIGKEPPVDVARFPFHEDVAVIENNCFDRVCHAPDCSMAAAFIWAGRPPGR